VKTSNLRSRGVAFGAIVALHLTLSGCHKGQASGNQLELAQAALLAGDPSNAEVRTKDILQAQPDNTKARALLARASLLLAHFDAAETESRRAIEQGNNDALVWEVLFESLVQRSQLLTLKSDAERVHANGSLSVETRALAAVYLGKILLAEGKTAEAKTHFENVKTVTNTSLAAKAGLIACDLALRAA
jgi:tetratricopeptide (TPR) repeat protein